LRELLKPKKKVDKPYTGAVEPQRQKGNGVTLKW